MIRFWRLKTGLLRIFIFIILLDLIFGGAGRLIMFGSLSFRTVLFGLSVIYILLNKKKLEGKRDFLIFCFVFYILIHSIVIGNAPYSNKFDFVSRYLFVVIVWFFDLYFKKHSNYEEIIVIRRLFEMFTFIFALFSIFLWLYAFRIGGAAYPIIEYGFFRPKVYGSFAILSGGIPRIFMKSSIFVSIGFLFQTDMLIDNPSLKNVIKTIIYGLAIITTFTSGFFIATAICTIILLNVKNVMKRKISILFILLIFLSLIFLYRYGIFRMMIDRYSSENYSGTYRLTQLASILREFIHKPIWGHGFGYEFTTSYGRTIRTTSNFEVAWGELLVDAGIIGFGLFIIIIITVLRQLLRLSKNEHSLFLFALGLILICLESFTNPFINNSIGLTYFGLCAGLGYAVQKKQAANGFDIMY